MDRYRSAARLLGTPAPEDQEATGLLCVVWLNSSLTILPNFPKRLGEMETEYGCGHNGGNNKNLFDDLINQPKMTTMLFCQKE